MLCNSSPWIRNVQFYSLCVPAGYFERIYVIFLIPSKNSATVLEVYFQILPNSSYSYHTINGISAYAYEEGLLNKLRN
jgi:hypothetical protein